MTNIPVSSIELRNETSTLKSISGDSVTVLEYSIDLVKDNLQGQRLTCVAVGDDTVYTETAVVTVKSMSSKKMCDNFQLNFSPAPSDPLVIVPSGSPVGFTTVAGEREVVFSWSPPPVTERNGVITSYTLSCSPSPSPPPQDLSQWLASLLTPATPVLWWPATLRVLDLLHPPHSPHCKTVSLANLPTVSN